MLLQQTKYLCKKHGIRPSRKKGQNFLIDEKILKKIIRTANLSRSDLVLEIGSGLGILTKELAKRAGRVIAVEIDKQLVKALREITGDYENVEIVEKDILFLKSHKLQVASFKIVANLPYNITSPVLYKFLTEEPRPQEMILMVQKEVAERITAKPGERGFLSVLVQFFAQPEIIAYVNKKSFWPEPKVDSAVIRISQIHLPHISQINHQAFFQLIKIGFSNRRKQLRNNLVKGLGIEKEKIEKIFKKMGLNIKVRAQDLTVEEWRELIEKSQPLIFYANKR